MFIFQGKLDWKSDSDLHVASNETITVIIPRFIRLGEPIHMFWQWTYLKDEEGKTNVDVHVNGTIDAFLSPTQFRYSSQSDYRFEATLIDNHTTGNEELSLVMSSHAGLTQPEGPFVLHRTFKLEPNVHDFLYPCLPAPRIYLGKLNWHRYARNELFIIVCPSRIDDKSPVCACWQWTETQSGRLKDPITVVSTYEGVTNGDRGLVFHFQDTGKWYTWACKVDEDKDELDVQMTAQQAKVDFTLRLLDLEAGLSQKQRDPPAIKNDTRDLVFCSTRSDGADVKGRSPASSSLIPVALHPNAGFTQYEWAMKVATTIASTRAADILDASELPSSQTLYAWEYAARKSSGGWVDPDSALTISRLYVDEKRTLKLQVGRIPGTGAGTLMLSELFSGSSPIKMEILSSFSIKPLQDVGTKGVELVAHQIFSIPGLKPASGYPTTEPGTYYGQHCNFTVNRNEDDFTLASFSPRSWEDSGNIPNPIFTFDPSSTFFVDNYIKTDGSCYQLSSGACQWYVVYAGCGITPVGESNIRRRLGKVSNQSDALAEAFKTPGAWAYSWSGEKDSPVWAWTPTTADSLKIDFQYVFGDPAVSYLYFIVHRLNEIKTPYLVARD